MLASFAADGDSEGIVGVTLGALTLVLLDVVCFGSSLV